MATHDLNIVSRFCPRLILNNHGRVIAQGSTQGILGNEELLEAHSPEAPFHFFWGKNEWILILALLKASLFLKLMRSPTSGR